MLPYLRHNWLVYKIHNEHLELMAQKYAGNRLLDIGCGEKPYKQIFAPYVTEHIGLDHKGTLHGKHEIDIYGSATYIPQEDNSYDTIFCGAVLEHLEEPAKAISEMNRVIKKNGNVIFLSMKPMRHLWGRKRKIIWVNLSPFVLTLTVME